MTQFRSIFAISSVACIFALVLGCSSEPKVTEFSPSADPQVELGLLKDGLKNASEAQVLSPENYTASKNALENAYRGRSSNKEQQFVLHQIALGRAYLERAKNFSNISRQILGQTISARAAALKANSGQYFAKETEKADMQLIKITSRFEHDDTSVTDQQKAALTEAYKKLEVDSVRRSALGDARKIIDESIKEGAGALTPGTLKWTEEHYRSSDLLIQSNPHDDSIVRAAGLDAVTSAKHLLKVVRDAKSSSAKDPEALALQVESGELAVAQAERDLDQAKSEIVGYKGVVETVSAENERMASRASVDQKADDAREIFSKDEATVYKQGNDVVLRLKGLSFASNDSAITTGNLPLLAKLQQAINKIGASRVSIEGYTDSLGTRELNERLSLKRAEAVQSFLLASNTVKAGNVDARGFGEAKPIASNSTPQGRAQNRHVDVILTSGGEQRGK